MFNIYLALSLVAFCYLPLGIRGVSAAPLVNPFTGQVEKEVSNDKVVVLVTGTSTGIGKDTVLEFAKNPRFKIYATMRDVSKSLFTKDTYGIENIVVKAMDVTSEHSVNTCVDEILTEERGRIDIVINNAGYGIAGCLEAVKVDEAQHLFDVNVWGAVRVLQAILPSMRKRKTGHVINISSISGMRGVPCMEYYSGSKFALEGISDSMRFSLSSYNISVTNVNAGPVRTPFTETFGIASKGGRGTRDIVDDFGPSLLPNTRSKGDEEASRWGYLGSLAQVMVDSMMRRMENGEAQNPQDCAQVVVGVALLKLDSGKRIEDIPFNIGSNRESQMVIEAVRKHPTGWGGMYSNLLDSIPALPASKRGGDEL
jgi:NADP-dependent 3-hydroxy acid dehydrogenase YdfG